MSGAGNDIYGTADQFRFVYKQLTGNGTLLARVDSLDNTHAWAKAGVMIRETLDMSSTWASVFYGGENGARYQARLTTAAGATSDTPVATADQIAQRAPVWIKIERLGNQFNGYYSQDGQNWTSMVWNPQTINMSSTVYIGLAVTSHVSGTLCGAEFSGIQSTGNVTGQWQVADVGIEQASGNSLDTLYVAVEDSAGHKKTVNADPGAVAAGDWTPWPIAISDLAADGVDMTRVKKMYLGVGDRNNPLHGAGKVYIDDIQYGHAVEE
jgi:regulation of enolase protein 1 (concanavalin A-like superfamily)